MNAFIIILLVLLIIAILEYNLSNKILKEMREYIKKYIEEDNNKKEKEVKDDKSA